jgi:hypothetical protein
MESCCFLSGVKLLGSSDPFVSPSRWDYKHASLCPASSLFLTSLKNFEQGVVIHICNPSTKMQKRKDHKFHKLEGRKEGRKEEGRKRGKEGRKKEGRKGKEL